MNLEKKLKRNIRIDYLFCFCRNFDLSSAVWVLYMGWRGLPLWQIGIAEGVFHVTSFLFEVPSGALADLAGRKNVMIWGRVLAAVSSVILLFSMELWQFLIGFSISAVSYNLNSGSEEALVYDSMKMLGKEESYIRVNGRLNMLIEISSGIAVFLGGVLAEKSYLTCYAAAAVVAVISIVPALFLTEPKIVKDTESKETVTWKEHFKTSIRIVRENPAVWKILLYYPVVETFYAVVFFYGQQYYAEAGLRRIQISMLMLVTGICSCLGALHSEKILQRFGTKVKYMVSFAMGISIFFVSGNQLVVSIAAFLVAGYVNSLIYPIASAALNELIPSEQRATIISIDSMCFSIGMVCFFPVTGLVAEVWNLHGAFLVLGIIEILLTAILVFCYKKKGKKS